MKLIQILALATAMATMATAQNVGANNQKKGGATPTPSPTPTPAGVVKSGSKSPAKSNAPVQPLATKTGTQPGVKPVVPAKAANGQKTAATAASGASTAGTPLPKTTIKSGSVHEKAKTGQTKTGQSTIKATPGVTPIPQTKTAVKTKAVAAPIKPKPHAKGTRVTSTKTGGATAASKGTSPTVKELGAAEKPKSAARAIGAHGRRDPFVSPIRNLGNVTPTPTCTVGKRCLSIPELILQGTVKDNTGKMMAVVANSSHHTYFLRENDQVFNGSVEKITSDSIIFREFVKDAVGRETAHEVVKKLVPAS